MLKITRFLLPSALLSLTILGLAALYSGGVVDVQFGPDDRVRIEGKSSPSTNKSHFSKVLDALG